MGKRLSCALFLDVVKSGSFNIQSRDKATVDAHGMIYTLLLTYYYAFDYQRQLICHNRYYIQSSAWVSVRCSFLTERANARASQRGTSDRVRLPRFFVYS